MLMLLQVGLPVPDILKVRLEVYFYLAKTLNFRLSLSLSRPVRCRSFYGLGGLKFFLLTILSFYYDLLVYTPHYNLELRLTLLGGRRSDGCFYRYTFFHL